MLFFLSEFQTSFSYREIGNENEEKRGEEGNVETNDLQKNPASHLAYNCNWTLCFVAVEEKDVMCLQDCPHLKEDSENAPQPISKLHSETPFRLSCC